MRTLKNSIIFLIIAVFIYGCGGGDGSSSGSAPSAPTGVTATATSGQVSISWTSVSGATSYNIYWSTTTGVTKTTGTKITGGTSPYTHTGLTNGTTYYYVVTAVNSYGESSESSQVSGTPQASLTFSALDLGKVVSFSKPYLIATGILMAGTGATGSSMDGFKVKVDKIELMKNDNTWVTVYSGSEYLETVGTAANSIAGVLNGSMPPAGIYTSVKPTISNFKIKVKIVSPTDGKTYYTTAQTVVYGSTTPWTLSTSSASYDYITITSVDVGNTNTTTFPTPLTVTGNSSVNLVWANEGSGIVTYNSYSIDGLPDAVTWASEPSLVTATLPGMPSKQIRFDLTASRTTTPFSRSNTITFLLDSSGNLLGGTCYRPAQEFINGFFLKSGSLSNVSNNGNTATFDVSFWEGMNRGYYQITGSYDCGASTSGTYSSLTVMGKDGVPDYTGGGYTLNTTGPVTCK
ncbi:MAG: fibronectin type III domain-containing protein [Nitrospinae bacterium]|nr:fibronectin type III domain-containing protein [Nitrospinota bacterium]